MIEPQRGDRSRLQRELQYFPTFFCRRSLARRFTPSEPQRHRGHRERLREIISRGAREPIEMLESEIHLSPSATLENPL